MNSIVFENITKAYGKNQPVIDKLNLEIKKGERLILLGPSGCGKSTILRMIAGLEDITGGNLYMNDRIVNDISSGERNVSMVFQNYALFPHMSVIDNISYGLKIAKLPKDEIAKRTKEALAMLELEGYENRKPKELSGGQRQRVALARAVVKQSDFFLLDEPLSNLDAQLRAHARKQLVKIHEAFHQTMVYVTHDQIEAMTVGQRIVLMNKGYIQMVDTPANVYHRPVNVFTARFIGSPPMNIVDVHYDGGKLYFSEKDFIPLPEMWCDVIKKSGKTELKFGIRPEDVILSANKEEPSVLCKIRYIENYGNDIGAYFSIAQQEMIAKSGDFVLMEGNDVFFIPDFEKIHLFDKETEQSIGYPHQLKIVETK